MTSLRRRSRIRAFKRSAPSIEKRSFPPFSGLNFTKVAHIAHGERAKVGTGLSEATDLTGFFTGSKSGERRQRG
jgi:hypothetical protein